MHSRTLGIAWVLINSKSARQRRTWEIFVFSHTFPVLSKFTFPIFWELHGFQLHPKNPVTSECFVFFPCSCRLMGFHFSHILGILWISASPETFKKPINFKCLCFPILFLYYENSLFPCFENCMDFCFTRCI